MPSKDMTRGLWHRCTDARDLMKHAAWLLASGHLALVLCELVERSWPKWHARYPDDWRPALGVAALRACVLDEAPLKEVAHAYDEMQRARKETTPYGRKELTPAFDVAAALCAALEAVRPSNSKADRERWASFSAYLAAAAVSPEPERAPEDLEDDEEREPPAAVADFAVLVRKWVVYPERRTDVFDIYDTGILTSGSVLLLDGWSLVEAVPGNLSGQLTATFHQEAMARAPRRAH